MRAAAPAAARVEKVFVREGEQVASGSPLLHLDQRDFTPQSAQAAAKVAELKARIDSEQLRYLSDLAAMKHDKSIAELTHNAVSRAQQMRKKKLGSAASVDLAMESHKRQSLTLTARELTVADHSARLQQLDAQLKQAEAEQQTAQLNLERSQFNAPFDGVIVFINSCA